jgi:UDP-N-acetylglucosamine 3-dehydrogenase
VGVVGYGAFGRHHARNLAALEEAALIGVVDPDPEARADAERAGLTAFADVEGLLAAGIEAAVVAVPTALHEAAADPLIDASCALLVEKPLASDLAAAQRIIARCRRAGVPLMAGYVERYNPAVVALCAFVRAGHLGRIVAMSAKRVGVLPPRVRRANVLIDIGVHDLDVVALITGGPLKLLVARGGMAVSNDELDYATLAVESAGCAVSLEVNWITPVKLRQLTITGTHCYCHLDYIKQTARFAPGRTFDATATYEALLAQYVDGTMIDLPVKKREPLARELQVFLDGVRGGFMPDPSVTLESLRIAQEATLAIAAQNSLEARNEPLEREQFEIRGGAAAQPGPQGAIG